MVGAVGALCQRQPLVCITEQKERLGIRLGWTGTGVRCAEAVGSEFALCTRENRGSALRLTRQKRERSNEVVRDSLRHVADLIFILWRVPVKLDVPEQRLADHLVHSGPMMICTHDPFLLGRPGRRCAPTPLVWSNAVILLRLNDRSAERQLWRGSHAQVTDVGVHEGLPLSVARPVG